MESRRRGCARNTAGQGSRQDGWCSAIGIFLYLPQNKRRIFPTFVPFSRGYVYLFFRRSGHKEVLVFICQASGPPFPHPRAAEGAYLAVGRTSLRVGEERDENKGSSAS